MICRIGYHHSNTVMSCKTVIYTGGKSFTEFSPQHFQHLRFTSTLHFHTSAPTTGGGKDLPSMSNRLTLLAHHIARPGQGIPRSALRIPSSSSTGISTMTTSNLIHTAACLIIGDEVLGGKVLTEEPIAMNSVHQLTYIHRRSTQIPPSLQNGASLSASSLNVSKL